MKFRYSISEKWSSQEIIWVMSALEFAVRFYEISDEKATLMCKMITGTEEPCEATADRIKGKRFELRLNRSQLNTKPAIIKAVMHEMTHVKQFINDGLRLYSKAAKFQGKQYDMLNAVDYWFAPWEMEARAMEEPLYRLYEEEQ